MDDSQDASKLTKRLGRPSRRFGTDETPGRNDPGLQYEFWISTTGSLGYGSVTNWIGNGTIVSDLRLGFGSVEGAPLSKIQKMQIPHFSGKWWEIVENATLR
ncbi:hypothetical protein GLOIN_2v1846614 [Rhizophagus irregularis DAOM 181602=DAOM 197198]|nr:hypothetical protein GLOIN_2v1846614 [Rhizophagus irregularis DAOM 181602=DAOM 197198]